MAQFTVQCPHCKQQFIGQTEWIGQQANCPTCGNLFTITDPPQISNVIQKTNKRFITQCPHCKQQFTAQTEWIGQQANCPNCGKTINLIKEKKQECVGKSKKGCTNNSLLQLFKNASTILPEFIIGIFEVATLLVELYVIFSLKKNIINVFLFDIAEKSINVNEHWGILLDAFGLFCDKEWALFIILSILFFIFSLYNQSEFRRKQIQFSTLLLIITTIYSVWIWLIPGSLRYKIFPPFVCKNDVAYFYCLSHIFYLDIILLGVSVVCILAKFSSLNQGNKKLKWKDFFMFIQKYTFGNKKVYILYILPICCFALFFVSYKFCEKYEMAIVAQEKLIKEKRLAEEKRIEEKLLAEEKRIEEKERGITDVENNIPFLPKFDEKYSFSWENASIDKIRKCNKEIISDKESEGKQFINAVGKDGVTRVFQFDSTKHLIRIMCKIDITDSSIIMVKLNEKYKKNEKPTTSDDGKYMVMIWRDKDSNTEIKIVTFTSNLQTFIMLKQLSE